RNRVARLNPNGTLDTSFDPGTGADNTVLTVAVQPDGKALIGGLLANYNGTARNHLARINGDIFVSFAAGDAVTKSFTVPIVDDSIYEGNETLTLTLVIVQGGATLGANPSDVLTIVDNETPPA